MASTFILKVTPAKDNVLQLDPDPIPVDLDNSKKSIIIWLLSGAGAGDHFTGFCWTDPPDKLPGSGIFTDPEVVGTYILICDNHRANGKGGTSGTFHYVINANIGGQIYRTIGRHDHEGITSTQDASIKNN